MFLDLAKFSIVLSILLSPLPTTSLFSAQNALKANTLDDLVIYNIEMSIIDIYFVKYSK